MTTGKPRWPSIDEMIENARKGIIDDREVSILPDELEDWEILGEAPPEEPKAPTRPGGDRAA